MLPSLAPGHRPLQCSPDSLDTEGWAEGELEPHHTSWARDLVVRWGSRGGTGRVSVGLGSQSPFGGRGEAEMEGNLK